MNDVLKPSHSDGASAHWFPHVTVASIVRKDSKYLMVRERYQGRSVLNQPAGHTYLRFAFCGELVERQKDYILDPAIEAVQWLDRKTLETTAHPLRSDVVLKCIADFEVGNALPSYSVQQLK